MCDIAFIWNKFRSDWYFSTKSLTLYSKEFLDLKGNINNNK